MEKASIISGSAVPFQTQNPNQVSVQLNTTFTPSRLASNYDSQMEKFSKQMGFGAVPNHVEKKVSRKRSSSRSTSQKRYVNK